MAFIKASCACGFDISVKVGDKVSDDKLQWFQTYHCDNCGKTIEIDDRGSSPHEVRNAIMEQEGIYSLCLRNIKNRVKTAFWLKKLADDNWDEFLLFLEKKSDVIIRGTQNEILFVRNYLKEKGGIECIISRE